MRLLLDTCVLLWWINRDSQLKIDIENQIRSPSNQVFVSAASAWEIAIKFNLGRLQLAEAPDVLVPATIRESRFTLLPILLPHALRAGALPWHHKDPFDRIIIAQSIEDDLTLVSPDAIFRNYRPKILW